MIAIVGDRSTVNYQLAELAAKQRPSVIFDTGNFFNPHKLHPHIPFEQFTQISVIEIQLLYKFQSALKQAKRIIPSKTKTIIVTSFHFLMNYQNKDENDKVLQNCIHMLEGLSKKYNVYIGVQPNTQLYNLTKRYHKMGHTVWSQRVALDVLANELKAYAKTLDKPEQLILNDMLTTPYQKVGSLTYTSSIHVWAFMLLTIMLEQEKRLQTLEDDFNRRIPEQRISRPVVKEWQTKFDA